MTDYGAGMTTPPDQPPDQPPVPPSQAHPGMASLRSQVITVKMLVITCLALLLMLTLLAVVFGVETMRSREDIAALSVRENIAVGSHLRHAGRADALDAASAVGESVGLGGQLDKSASVLTVAGRKRLELARALAIEPRLLLLDEVLAGLNPSEVRDMVPVVRAIGARGVTILMIEHVMQAVMSLAEHVYVLSEGRIIAEGSPRVVAGDRRVVEAYLGRGAAARMTGEMAHA